MKIHKLTRLGALLVSAMMLGAPVARAADTEDDKKKAEKDLKKAEEAQGEKKEGEGGGLNPLEGNPLEKILELMKSVEEKLVEVDTGSATQEEQKKIVDALKFGGKAKTALDELIKKIEDMQSQSESQSQSEQDQQQQKQKQKQQQNDQQKNETPEQKKEREQKERERQEREKREEERRKQQNPQQQKKEPKDGAKNTKNDKKEQGKNKDEQSKLDPRVRQGGEWGNLPAKLHQDAEKARQENVPEKFRDSVERYRKAVAD